jgi:hypothetical protein
VPIGKGRSINPDFLIVDPQSGEYLAIIEVKQEGSNLSGARKQLELYKQALGNPNIRTYVITRARDGPGQLSISLLDDRLQSGKEGVVSGARGEKEVDTSLFPKFEALKADIVAGKKTDIRLMRKRETNSLQLIGVIIAIILILFVIADFILSFLGIKLLTTERLSVMGVVVVMVLIPYIQKFKGLGIEWELVTKGSTKDESKLA